ncbi:MAG: magnesium and cobalt transport protein CorA [Candidatus Nanopelagicales bacterium]
MIEIMGAFKAGAIAPSLTVPSPAFGSIPGSPDIGDAVRECANAAGVGSGAFVWIALFEPTKVEMELVAKTFDLPRLQVEDAINYRQRAKLEFDDERAFAVFKLLEYVELTSDIETGQMAVFVGPHYVVTVRHRSSGSMRWVLDNVDETRALAEHGPLAILHAVLDHAVDEYLDVIDQVSADIEKIEESVFSPTRSDEITAIYELKRENLEIRRAISPMVQVANSLTGAEHTRLPEQLRPYFSDLADHVLRAGDGVDNNDSLLFTILMASTAQADLQQNADMRRISAWVAIAAVPTMVAGIYGMNFDDMPELHQAWGYPAVLLLMASVCSFMYTKFKKSGWL